MDITTSGNIIATSVDALTVSKLENYLDNIQTLLAYCFVSLVIITALFIISFVIREIKSTFFHF